MKDVFIIDNSKEQPLEVAQKEIDGELEILDKETWNLLRSANE